MFEDKLKRTIEIARTAGQILLDNFEKIKSTEIYFKNPKDIVTEIDKKTEKHIVDNLHKYFPED
ncbi:inositol monophosphatase, partial [Candidatus Dependentiae bacterium]|nr:inositol monophosphatase [Candidatus Dependentiae bacterium]